MSAGNDLPVLKRAPPTNEPDVTPWKFYGEGDLLYTAMLNDIAQAQHIIRLESYIFSADEIGWRIGRALAHQALMGVTVQVHVDAAGALFEDTRWLYSYLRQSGVELRLFNRWRWRQPWRYNQRNHRKMLIVDRRCLYVGGFNIHRQSSFASIGAQRWRDVQVRVADSLTESAITLFDALWNAEVSPTAPPWQDSNRLITNATRSCRRLLHCLYLDALNNAVHTICLTTPYFVPDRRLRCALVAAAKRGVDVRVLLPANGNNPLVKWASQLIVRRLSQQGIRFYEYLPRMLHAKHIVIDGRWAMIGSANVDYRSFFINHEIVMISETKNLCVRLERLFEEDLQQAREVERQVPDHARWQYLCSLLAFRLRRWL